MNDRKPPWEASALVEKLKRVEAPATAKAHILARLGTTIGACGGGSGGSGASHEAAAGGSKKVASWIRRLASPPVSAAATAVVSGVVGAFAGRGMLPERVVYVDRVVTVEASASDPPGNASSPAPSETIIESAAATPPTIAPKVARVTAPARTDSELGAERAVLDVARAALGRGDGVACLDAVARHEARFPKGVLSEEREAIAVQALLLVARDDEARSRAAQFRKRFPGSLLAPAVDAVLDEKR